MNFTSLTYFITLVQERTFTHAARRLHVTQQTLSAHIAQLEREIGAPLVVRRVPLSFTWTGQVFYQHALKLHKEEDAMRKALADACQEETGCLRIGIAPNREHAILPAILERYTGEHPGIRIQMTEDINRHLIQKLSEGGLDLAIVHMEQSLAGITQEAFYQEEMILLIPNQLLIGLAEAQQLPFASLLKRLSSGTSGCLAPLARAPFLLSESGTVPGRLARRLLAEADIEPFVRVSSDNLRLLLELCAAGSGLMFCPANLIARNLTKQQRQRLTRIPLRTGERLISFCYRRELHDWSLLAAFMDTARQIMHTGQDH